MEKKIKEAMEIAGFKTAKAAAERMGVVESYLGGVIRGRQRISWNLAFKLEEFLGLSAKEIMNDQLEREYLKKKGEKNADI